MLVADFVVVAGHPEHVKTGVALVLRARLGAGGISGRSYLFEHETSPFTD